MKKFIFSAIAAIGLLLSPSCSDENEALSGSGNEALVSFSVNLADGIQTKADPTTTTTLGDGTKAQKLVVDVFEKNTTTNEYTRIGSLRHKTDDGQNAFDDELKATVNFNLVKGKTYRLIFWAQKQSVVSSNANSPYNIDDLSKIKVNYHAGIEDDEDRDAFLGVTEDITVNGNFTKSITMTRPFAQLNYLIDKAEYDAAVLAGMDIKKAVVTVAKVAKTLRPLTNTVADFEENVTFEVTPIPTDFDATPLTGEAHLSLPKAGNTSGNEIYYYLASKYFLVAAGNEAANSALEQATLATTSFKLVNSSNREIADYEFKVPAVPVQWNYRTNIYGNLITSEGEFKVNIVPGFYGEENLPQSAAVVNNSDEIADKIAEGATTIIASENFSLSTTEGSPTEITVPKSFALGNDKELTFDFSAVATSNTTIKIQYDSQSSSAPATVNVVATGKVEIYLEDSHVTLNGNTVNNTGTYTEVTASTSSTTLVVPNGVTVEKLIVKAGNVRIEKGGKVTNIERHEEAAVNKPTYVTIVTGGELTNTPEDEKIIITYEDATEGKVVLNGVYSFNTVKEAVAYAASKNISDVKLVLADNTYNEVVSIPRNMTLSIESKSGIASNVVLNGQLASLSNGIINLQNITISHSNASDQTNGTNDVTGISQTGNSAIALWGAAIVNCDNVIFENLATDATAITAWWSTGKGTQINVKNSTFNCGGQRPIRSDANVTVEGCTFNDPYRYAVQMTSKASTMSAENAVVNFKNNTINAGSTTDKPVYGIQLEGETYGCSNLIINGSGNTIYVGETGKSSAMYYCECGKVDHTSIVWNTTDGTPKHANEHEVSTVEDFVTALTTAGNAKGDQTISITADLDFSSTDWTPVTVQGYTGTGVITINGNNHTISGLKDALFAGGFAGRSGIIINDLTIDGTTVNVDQSPTNQGWGYFIKSIDSMPMISLTNCHLKNANVTSTGGARVGGLIGWTAGYNNPNDGPVDTYVTITNCSVTNSNITAKGSVGAIIGHAGNNPATYHTITGCTVTNCTLHSMDDGDWRVGVVVGTANVGEVTISNITESGNIVQQDGKTAPEHSNLYGRFVPDDTGKLTIDGVEITE